MSNQESKSDIPEMSTIDNECVKSSTCDNEGNKPDIMEYTNLEVKYQSVLERYYKPMYCLNIDGKPIDHQCVLFHSNKICLLTLAPSHPIIKHNITISRINFNVDGNVDRLKNKVSGKGKRGGQKLMPNTVLCEVQTADGNWYKIYSCIKGKLIEINETLIEGPIMLLAYPKTIGHIAVLLSDLSTVEMCKRDMIDQEEYDKIKDLPERKAD